MRWYNTKHNMKLKNFLKKVFKKKWVWGVSALVLILVIWLLTRGGVSAVKTVAVVRGDVNLEISVVGKVKPSHSLDMGFVQSGKINRLPAKVGDEVAAGQILAVLDNGDLSAQLRQSQASLAIQQAKLAELESGTRPESLAVKEAELKKSQADLANEYTDIVNVLNDVFVKADDAVTKKTDAFFDNDNESNPTLSFVSGDQQAVIDAEWQRSVTGQQLKDWQNESAALNLNSLDDAQKAGLLTEAETRLNTIRTFLNRLGYALQAASNLSAATLDCYNTSLNTARVNVNAAIAAVTSQEQAIVSQKAVADRIQKEYNLLLAGNVPEQVTAQRAQVTQAEANVSYAGVQLEKTYLRAPFRGKVTKVVFDIGDIVNANQAVVSLVGAGKFQIETNVAESDVARIKIGNTANVTLDAYGDEPVFGAVLSQIDLAATTIDGVAVYKTVFQFNDDDPRILAGLTANVDIDADKKEGVLFVPTRSVIARDGKKIVPISVNGVSVDKEVTVGLRGSDGRWEIISGLNEGDLAITN